MGLTNSKKLKKAAKVFYERQYDAHRDLVYDSRFESLKDRNRELQRNVVLQSQSKWISLLTKENYNTLATIQKPMRNPHMLDANLERFFNLSRVNKLFYSVGS